MARVAVIYYSSTGHVHQLATALAESAEAQGADVRMRLVAELAPPEAIEANPAWARFRGEVAATASAAAGPMARTCPRSRRSRTRRPASAGRPGAPATGMPSFTGASDLTAR